jgi:hypothetical protein
MEEYLSEAVGKGKKGQFSELLYEFKVPEHPRVPQELWGKVFPVTEAVYDMAFFLFKKHYKDAIMNDGFACAISNGAMDRYEMEFCFIGSNNQAFHLLKDGKEVIHSVIRKLAAEVRDGFDTGKAPVFGRISLHTPPDSQKLATRYGSAVKHRRKKAKKKNAAQTTRYEQTIVKTAPQSEEKPKKKKTRELILGIPHRPSPPIRMKQTKLLK